MTGTQALFDSEAEGPVPPSVILSTFQSGHGWVASGTGSQRDDTSDFSVGSQSLAISPLTGRGEQKTTLTVAATDLSASYLGLRLRLSGAATKVVLRVASGTITSDFAEAVVYEKDTIEPWLYWDGQWAPTWLVRNMFTVTGTVDWTRITSVQIAATASFNDPDALLLNWLAVYPEAPTGVISITFDDGLATQYANALPILDLYELPATAYIIADVIDSGGAWMTEDDLLSLQNDYGWEVASHAATLADHNAGFDSLTAEEVQADMLAVRQWLSDRGLHGGDQFAWPLGQTLHEPVARRLFSASVSTRGADGRQSELTVPQPHDRQHLRRWSVNGLFETVTNIRAAIDEAAASRTWLILCFHNILASGSPSVGTDFRASDLAAVIAYVRASGLPVRTVGDQMRRATVASPPPIAAPVVSIVYDGDVNAARPMAIQARWIGWPSEPTNWLPGDEWLEPA